ncbi:Uncharacterized protein TCM_034185 [Theobroma cacao]|uniref:Uncharacterized protein n=1 Tax=Theobroma cacao TaxID=3641 RepID=A0A061FE09_THECC|nr:Uncharacterized protein TCM_034185 [Theobroma cacao]
MNTCSQKIEDEITPMDRSSAATPGEKVGTLKKHSSGTSVIIRCFPPYVEQVFNSSYPRFSTLLILVFAKLSACWLVAYSSYPRFSTLLILVFAQLSACWLVASL